MFKRLLHKAFVPMRFMNMNSLKNQETDKFMIPYLYVTWSDKKGLIAFPIAQLCRPIVSRC